MRPIALAVALVLGGCGAEWEPSSREPVEILFSWVGDCAGADEVIELAGEKACTWGCAVVRYSEIECPPHVARWTHSYRREGDGWAFRRQSWVDGCWERH